MSTNFRKFAAGIQILPASASAVSLQGDLDVDSVSAGMNYHNGTTSSVVVTANHQATLLNKILSDTTVLFGNASDTSKALKFDLSGATTGKTLTIAAPVTLARTLTLPDATDTLVGKATTDTLTNKSIDGGTNTLTNIASGSIAGSIPYSKLALTGSILNADLAGAIAYSKLVLTGSILNADLAGSIAYSKLSLTNSILNADINSTAAINLSKTDKLFDTEATLTQVATPASPASGKNKFYPKVDGFFYSLDSTGAERKIGSGAGGINYFSANPDIESGITGFTVGADGAIATISNATPSVLTATSHGLVLGQQVYLTTSGTLPSGFSVGVPYWVSLVPTSGTFQLAASLGGSSVGTASAGTGVHFFRPSVPSTGTGALAPTATISASASTALRGTKNLLLTPGNVGDYLLYTITPDSADTAKMLQFSFDYSITTPLSYVDGDLQVYLYDVGNSQLIQPAAYKILSTSKPSTFKCVFQTPGTGMSTIRVLVIQNTPNVAYTSARFDNFNCGPQTTSLGPPVSDWASYTPTGAFNTNTTYAGRWRRVGDTMELEGAMTFAGAPNAVTATISLPPGYTIDTTKLSGGGSISNDEIGTACIFDTAVSGSGRILGRVIYGTTTAVQLTFMLEAAASTNSTRDLNATSVLTIGANTKIAFKFSVPITGWSSNVLMSQDTDTRVVAMNATGIPATTLADAVIIFPTMVKDTHGGYSAITGRYAAPVPGYYNVTAAVFTSGASAGKLYAAVNAVRTGGSMGGYYNTTNAAAGSVVVYANAGDLIDVRLDVAGTGYGSNCSLSINRLSGPATIAATETIAAFYQSTTATSWVSNGTIFNFDTKVYDTHGAVTIGASWKFTAPIGGKYRVSSACYTTSVAGTAGKVTSQELFKNGSTTAMSTTTAFAQVSTAMPKQSAGFAYVQLVAGDYLDLRTNGNDSSVYVLNGVAAQNYIAIERVGN